MPPERQPQERFDQEHLLLYRADQQVDLRAGQGICARQRFFLKGRTETAR
jgi:hypothetical protein